MTNLFLGFLNRSLSAAVLILQSCWCGWRSKSAEMAAVRPVGAGGGAAFVPVLD